MNTEQFKLLLSIWGAGLSTLLGFLTIIKFKRESGIKLNLISTIDSPYEHVRLNIVNLRPKPATLVAYSIGIGVGRYDQIEILKINLSEAKKMNESDIWSGIIERNTLVDAFNSKEVNHLYFQVLWSNAHFSNNKTISSPVYINPEIINYKHYSKAERYIATDIFLNRPPLESNIFKVGHKD